MKPIIFLLMLFSTISYSQCNWETFFPFAIGDSKFEISKKKSINPTIVDYKSKTNYDFSKYDNSKRKFDYLKDSVQINRVHLEYQKNECFVDNTQLDLVLVNDKLYKAEITIKFNSYSEMIIKYNYLIDNAPDRYVYEYKNTITNPDTKEKIGEGYLLVENDYKDEERDEVWNDYLSISYSFTYEQKWDDKKRKFYYTNTIKEYELEFKLVDMRDVILTRYGY